MHGLQNNLAELFILNICSGKLKVKVSPEGRTIKWSLASVDHKMNCLVHKHLNKRAMRP